MSSCSRRSRQEAAREVARRLGVELHLLDGEYKKIAANAASLKEQLTSFLAADRPDYVFAPPQSGDWSPDHTSAAQIAFESFLDSGSLGQWNARFLRYPIPATTTSFQANVWVELPPAMIETKMELAATMTRGRRGHLAARRGRVGDPEPAPVRPRGGLAGHARRGFRLAVSDPVARAAANATIRWRTCRRSTCGRCPCCGAGRTCRGRVPEPPDNPARGAAARRRRRDPGPLPTAPAAGGRPRSGARAGHRCADAETRSRHRGPDRVPVPLRRGRRAGSCRGPRGSRGCPVGRAGR